MICNIIDYKRGMELKSGMIIRGMPESYYHSINRISQTALKRWAVSIADGLHSTPFDADASEAATKGSAVHSLLLDGQEMFDEKYATGGPINPKTGTHYGRDTKKFQEWMKEQGGKSFLTEKEMKSVMQMVDSIKRDDFAMSVITMYGTERELTLLWSEDIEGVEVLCKARLDWWGPGIGIVDVKSTCDVDKKGFEKSVGNRGWYVQSWWYPRGAVMTGLTEHLPEYAWIVLENQPPHKLACYKPDDPASSDEETPNALGWMQATGRAAAYRGLKNYALHQSGSADYVQTTKFIEIDTPSWVWESEADLAEAGKVLK